MYINPDTKIRLNLWEVGSSYKGLGKDYCNDAKIAIIFKDILNDYLEYEEWIPEDLPKVYVEHYKLNDNKDILDKVCEEICLKELHL